MAEELVLMKNVSKYYGRVRALDDVTFRVFPNEIVGLLGDNGAGKSTLIKVLSGAVRLTSGEIHMKGRQGRHQEHHRCDRQWHRDDLPGLRAGDPTLHHAQPVPRTRADQGAEVSQQDGSGRHGAGRARSPEARRHHQEHSADDADRVSLGRRAPGRGDCARHAFSQRSDHSRRADQQSRRRRNAGRAAVRAQRPRLPAIPASSSLTTSITSSRSSTASW